MNYLKWKDHRQQVRNRRDEIRAQLDMIDLRIWERYPEVQHTDRISFEVKDRSIAIKAIGLALSVSIIIVISGVLLHSFLTPPKEIYTPPPNRSFIYSGTPDLSATSGGTISPSFSGITSGTNSKSMMVGPSATIIGFTTGYEMTQPIIVGSGMLSIGSDMTSSSCIAPASSGVLTNAVCSSGSTK